MGTEVFKENQAFIKESIEEKKARSYLDLILSDGVTLDDIVNEIMLDHALLYYYSFLEETNKLRYFADKYMPDYEDPQVFLQRMNRKTKKAMDAYNQDSQQIKQYLEVAKTLGMDDLEDLDIEDVKILSNKSLNETMFLDVFFEDQYDISSIFRPQSNDVKNDDIRKSIDEYYRFINDWQDRYRNSDNNYDKFTSFAFVMKNERYYFIDYLVSLSKLMADSDFTHIESIKFRFPLFCSYYRYLDEEDREIAIDRPYFKIRKHYLNLVVNEENGSIKYSNAVSGFTRIIKIIHSYRNKEMLRPMSCDDWISFLDDYNLFSYFGSTDMINEKTVKRFRSILRTTYD